MHTQNRTAHYDQQRSFLLAHLSPFFDLIKQADNLTTPPASPALLAFNCILAKHVSTAQQETLNAHRIWPCVRLLRHLIHHRNAYKNEDYMSDGGSWNFGCLISSSVFLSSPRDNANGTFYQGNKTKPDGKNRLKKWIIDRIKDEIHTLTTYKKTAAITTDGGDIHVENLEEHQDFVETLFAADSKDLEALTINRCTGSDNMDWASRVKHIHTFPFLHQLCQQNRQLLRKLAVMPSHNAYTHFVDLIAEIEQHKTIRAFVQVNSDCLIPLTKHTLKHEVADNLKDLFQNEQAVDFLYKQPCILRHTWTIHEKDQLEAYVKRMQKYPELIPFSQNKAAFNLLVRSSEETVQDLAKVVKSPSISQQLHAHPYLLEGILEVEAEKRPAWIQEIIRDKPASPANQASTPTPAVEQHETKPSKKATVSLWLRFCRIVWFILNSLAWLIRHLTGYGRKIKQSSEKPTKSTSVIDGLEKPQECANMASSKRRDHVPTAPTDHHEPPPLDTAAYAQQLP